MSRVEKTEEARAFFAALEKSDKRDTYCSSLAYYMLTGRKGAGIYTDGTAYLVVAKHPHVEDRLLVFPEVNGNGSLTVRVLSDIDIPRGGVQLARYSDDDLNILRAAPSIVRSHKQIELLEIEESVMDWRHPVHILDTDITGAMQGKVFHPVRNNFNRAAEKLTVKSLQEPDALLAMRASVLIWAAAMIYGRKETGHSLTEFYDTLVAMIEKKPDMFDGFVTFENGEPAGFTIWDKAHNNTVNAIAGLSRKSVKGMSEFQTVTACRLLAAQGVKFYNMGGSETEGLNHHKKLYQPAFSFALKSYEVKVQNTLTAHIRSFDMPGL